MARYTIENDSILIQVDDHGAELKSLVRKRDHTEYMWKADPAFWGRTSPVLFPFVGMVADGKYRAKGETYEMGQHGFARDMDFVLEEQTDDAIRFVLESNEDTLQKYPYSFRLHIGYELAGSSVKVIWKVENLEEGDLPFSIGGHPAFNCPIKEGESQEEYFLKFEKKTGDELPKVFFHRLENGVASDKEDVYTLDDGFLPIDAHLFDKDALVIENQNINKVSLCGKDKKPYLTVTMDSPLFGVWSPVGKGAPFVCIEPWYGRCDAAGFTGDITEREFGNTLAPGEVFQAQYEISI